MECFDDVIIGAGPAGCGAFTALSQAGRRVLVLEKLRQPGGLASTVVRNGNRFDIGPHRFFTKSPEVLELWRNVIGEDLLSVNRLTRIYYQGRLVNYPLSPLNALKGLGGLRAASAVFSYVGRRLKRKLLPREPQSFEDWVTDQFGAVLMRAFFKDYTEKVWGIPCSQVSAEWAAQRIKGLSLSKAVLNALRKKPESDVKTLAERFLYPRWGAGEFCENVAHSAANFGCEFRFGAEVEAVELAGRRVRSVLYRDQGGERRTVEARNVLCSAPLTHLAQFLRPPAPPQVLEAARALRFRDHIAVNLLLGAPPFPDNWIYVHTPAVRLGRVVNYRSFSEVMCAADGVTPVTVEYFVFRGDEVESLADKALCDLAVRELKQLGLLSDGNPVQDAFVTRSYDAYPVLERGYQDKVRALRQHLSGIENLWPMGRGGTFKYNNQDHSVMTGLLAARNALGSNYDVWSVNIDAEYHESGAAPEPSAE